MSNRSPKQPEEEAAPKLRPTRRSLVEPINWIILTVDFLIMGAGIFMSWRAMQTATYETELKPQVEQRIESAHPKSSAAGTAANSVPALKLNQSHQRTGPEIEVDPNNIGRTNPFQNP